ncbi:hypothetical protein FPSE_04553 [Fusarium pseudograminearum CS3096]|uniref:Uncharacterized protein n=1 Tax=Fusarium pseudograminearum (strain CS3096) TaxID=1028729 RepID=K3USE1_FUSPC|nr:hypothetical protein FPSE_04553 [Fusarium pseudograminearum CS3096]EKJ75296.1 hypothetical protein FPSE_04553 [Fusarium pseudograminearum CS3096]
MQTSFPARAFVSPFTNTALDYYQYFMPRCPVSHSQVPGISWALLHNSLTQKLTLQAVPAKSLAWKNRKTTHKNLKAQVADSSPEHLAIAAGQVTGATIAGYYEVIDDYCPSSSKGSKKSLVKKNCACD